jgi:hypothetical protein
MVRAAGASATTLVQAQSCPERIVAPVLRTEEALERPGKTRAFRSLGSADSASFEIESPGECRPFELIDADRLEGVTGVTLETKSNESCVSIDPSDLAAQANEGRGAVEHDGGAVGECPT